MVVPGSGRLTAVLIVAAVAACAPSPPPEAVATPPTEAKSTAAPLLSCEEISRWASALPWNFSISAEEGNTQPSHPTGPLSSTVYRLKAEDPVATSAEGEILLRITVEHSRYRTIPDAEKAFLTLLASADPDTGLSYAWDAVILSSAEITHLHAPCVVSEANFATMSEGLEDLLFGGRADEVRTLRCRCGGGCKPY